MFLQFRFVFSSPPHVLKASPPPREEEELVQGKDFP